ncbi:MAG: bifunctional molybdenum cofactor biosynthesis protein MoaC/MoaB [Formosimonas sp.]
MNQTFQMINVGHKPITHRIAIARGQITLGADAFELLRNRSLPKGDALILAEVAGIQGAKNASSLMPLCHPMGLDAVQMAHELHAESCSVSIYCTASTHAKTGVEMEALAGVNAALLTIWDLCKMINPHLQMNHIELLAKVGGKSGLWLNPNGVPDWVREQVAPRVYDLSAFNFAVLTLSDRASSGVYADKSGALLVEMLHTHQARIHSKQVLPDDAATLKNTLLQLSQTEVDCIISTGGTGVAPRDITPEVVHSIADKTIDGLGELLRISGAAFTTLSWASRATAAVVNQTLIITLPGSPKAVAEGMDVLIPILPHFIKIMKGLP